MRRVSHIVQSIATAPVVFLQGIYTVLCVSAIILASILSMRHVMQSIVRIWGRGIFLLMGKWIHVTGSGNIPEGRRFMVLVNHASIYDIPAVMAVFSHVVWLGRAYLLRIPLFGRALRMLGYIPVSRNPSHEGMRIITETTRYAGNITVAIFPEGTRTLDGLFGDFRRGFILIGKRTDLDVLPVTLNGLFHLKSKIRFRIDFTQRVGVTIHKPIPNTLFRRMSKEQILKDIRRTMESAYEPVG